jgi:hypothetical protein
MADTSHNNTQTDCQNKSTLPQPGLIVNLSDHVLTEDETSILSKGLNFSPTPGEPNIGETANDIDKFIRRLRLKLFFQNLETQNEPPTHDDLLDKKFRVPSTWTPYPGQDIGLDAFAHFTKRLFHQSTHRITRFSNTTTCEIKALKSLQHNKNFVIKRADKGSAIVLWDRTEYVAEANRQLSDSATYTLQTTDLTKHHTTTINSLLSQLQESKQISEKVFLGLEVNDPRTARLYLLPKIHKGKPRGQVPGRPIISGSGCPTEKISSFVDEHIKPFVPSIPSYVRDTADFINKVERIPNLPNQFHLVTLDVTSLYTNIPNHEGMVAVAKCLRDNHATYTITHNKLLALLRLVLHCNNFEFDGKHYLQCGGTAMGTRLAPSYANLFMGELEKKLLSGYPLKPTIFLRFIDDIFMIWTHGEDSLLNFVEYLNHAHHSIKFTMEYSTTEVTFLDTRVSHNPTSGNIEFDLYTKPTDSHAYLWYTSAHPPRCKASQPYGQFLRLKRICTRTENYEKHASDLLSHYTKRGYPLDILKLCREKASKQERKTLLLNTSKKVADKPVRTPLIMTYNPFTEYIGRTVHKLWPLLYITTNGKEAFNNRPIIAYRHNKNLTEHLVRAKLATERDPSGIGGKTIINPIPPCHFSNCKICDNLPPQRWFRSTHTGIKYPIKIKATCVTRNVIYLITCNKCNKQYVGETKRTFRTRIHEHFRDITRSRDSPVARHFHLLGHSTENVTFAIIEVRPNDPDDEKSTTSRRTKEHYWIHQLRTMAPVGINQFG